MADNETLNRPAAGRGVSLAKRTDAGVGGRGIPIARYSQSFRQDGVWDTRLVTLISLTMVGLAILALILTAEFSSVRQRLFPSTSDGKLVSLLPVRMPMPKEEVVTWANTAAMQIMTFGFHDWPTRQEKIRPYFTETGWSSFLRALRTPSGGRPNFISLLEDDRLIVWSRPLSAPVILDQRLVSGVYQYRVRLYLQINVRSRSIANNVFLTYVDLDIARTGLDVNSDGIAISTWQFLRN